MKERDIGEENVDHHIAWAHQGSAPNGQTPCLPCSSRVSGLALAISGLNGLAIAWLCRSAAPSHTSDDIGVTAALNVITPMFSVSSVQPSQIAFSLVLSAKGSSLVLFHKLLIIAAQDDDERGFEACWTARVKRWMPVHVRRRLRSELHPVSDHVDQDLS